MVQYSSTVSPSNVYGELAVIDNSDDTLISGTSTWQEVVQLEEGHPPQGITTVSGFMMQIPQDGVYQISWHACATAATAAKDFEFGVSVNGTTSFHTIIQRHFSTNTDMGAMAGSSIDSLSEGDILKFELRNIDDTSNITVENAVVTVHKL